MFCCSGSTFNDIKWLQERHDWPGLKAVVMVESEREIGDRIERETRFYLTSLALMACMLGPIVRSHWAIENSLHWVLDMVFRDDECPGANRSCACQLLYHQAHGTEPDPTGSRQGFVEAQAEDRGVGMTTSSPA